MLDLESASALVRTFYTVPLLVVTVVVVGAVLVRRRPGRRRRAASYPHAAAAPHALARAPAGSGAGGAGRPPERADPRDPAAACAEHGHDLVVDHDHRTGLPARIRCANPACGGSWDAVPDTGGNPHLPAGGRFPAPTGPTGPAPPPPPGHAPEGSWRAPPDGPAQPHW